MSALSHLALYTNVELLLALFFWTHNGLFEGLDQVYAFKTP